MHDLKYFTDKSAIVHNTGVLDIIIIIIIIALQYRDRSEITK